MDHRDYEELAAVVRRRAGVGAEDLPLATEIACRILGPKRVVFGLAGTSARFEHGRIIVPVDHRDVNFVVAHELAHWALETIAGFTGTFLETEDAANFVGAAICAPADLVRRAHAHYVEDILPLSKVFGLSQTCTTLRLGEVLHSSRAVVTVTGRVLARDAAWRTHIPALEIARGRMTMKGVRKVRFEPGLDVDQGRVSLRQIA